MANIKKAFLLLFCILGVSYQHACSSTSDCTTGTCYTVSTTSSSTSPCTYTISGSGSPAEMPYQECLTSDEVSDIDDDTSCTATEVDETQCDDDTDCSTQGDCCIPQTCLDDTGSSSTNYICSPAGDQSSSTTTENGCTYGTCVTTNYVPTNFPCDTTSQCTSLYQFASYCCSSLTCNGDAQPDHYCVPSGTAGLQEPDQFGGSDASCLALCDNPNDAICTAVAPDQETGTSSECAPYDDLGTGQTFCCAVTGESNGDYNSGEQGICMGASALIEPIANDNTGTFTVCGAVENLTLSLLAFIMTSL